MLVAARSCARVHLTFRGTSSLEPFAGFQQRYRLTPVRMVEGHGCHRVAHAHRKLLLGKRFVAKSPNGRFTEGAEAVHQQPLTRIEVHGKNLFYFFGEVQAPKVVHIHFGMSGAFKTMTLPGPETTETTRLTLENQDHNIIAHLSAMTVNLGDIDYYKDKSSKLGPDPLREDADPERLWDKMKVSKKPVGGLLMDQTTVAGIGNIYRAEILFKAGVHPEQPGRTVSRESFETLWKHSVLLLQRGFKTGSIITVDEEEAKKLGKPWTRRYVYNHNTCGRCGSPINTWDMQARTVYACQTCQPLHLDPANQLAPARASALQASKGTKQFKSHCAPEAPAQAVPAQMTVKELKAALQGMQLQAQGTKPVLLARLLAAQPGAEGTEPQAEAEAKPAGPAGGVQPGLPQDEGRGIGGPEPLMGVKRLDKLEQGHLVAGTSAAPVDQDLAAQQSVAPAKMLVPQLKEQLKTFNMPVSGKKADLVHRLETALAAAAASGHASDAASPATDAVPGRSHEAEAASATPSGRAAAATTKAASPVSDQAGLGDEAMSPTGTVGSHATASQQSMTSLEVAALDGDDEEELDRDVGSGGEAEAQAGVAGVRPGTEGLGDVATFEAAAREKAAAGEGRNIEHVAEADDRTHTADTKKRKKTSSQQKAENPGLPEASQAKKRKSRTKAK
ncbi:hypothetical protein ABBQ38_014251 [Trebouxia sp. C0009 RCD-2024]